MCLPNHPHLTSLQLSLLPPPIHPSVTPGWPEAALYLAPRGSTCWSPPIKRYDESSCFDRLILSWSFMYGQDGETEGVAKRQRLTEIRMGGRKNGKGKEKREKVGRKTHKEKTDRLGTWLLWLVWSTEQKKKQVRMQDVISRWCLLGTFVTMCSIFLWNRLRWQATKSIGACEFVCTVKPRYTGPKNNGNPPITDAKPWSLQVNSINFLYWQ